MTTILDKIIAYKQNEVHLQKQQVPLNALESKILNIGEKASFKNALKQSSTGIIAEFKRKSPSKDWIFKDAKINEIIPSYTQGRATAISVLTDTHFFGGNLEDLQEASLLTNIPILRKDFIIDEYQIYQAKCFGASAILLIAAALTIEDTKKLAQRAKALSLDVLLEIHNENELSYINEYTDVIGVNNRNLKTFVTDIETSLKLIDKIPNEFVKISESGISSTQSVKKLHETGYKGFLMGENFMKTNNPGESLKQFIKELQGL